MRRSSLRRPPGPSPSPTAPSRGIPSRSPARRPCRELPRALSRRRLPAGRDGGTLSRAEPRPDAARDARRSIPPAALTRSPLGPAIPAAPRSPGIPCSPGGPWAPLGPAGPVAP
uniref:Uncharacterized protein n=1 Tax=Apteryx owenii TaxID=8824 RepID=A0A8B9SFX9_APTOW